MCCAQKLHTVRERSLVCKSVQTYGTVEACARKRLSGVDLFRYVHLYIGTLNVNVKMQILVLIKNYVGKRTKKSYPLDVDILKNNFQQYTYSSFFLNYSTSPHSWSERSQRAKVTYKII